jgi:hypothetical protein
MWGIPANTPFGELPAPVTPPVQNNNWGGVNPFSGQISPAPSNWNSFPQQAQQFSSNYLTPLSQPAPLQGVYDQYGGQTINNWTANQPSVQNMTGLRQSGGMPAMQPQFQQGQPVNPFSGQSRPSPEPNMISEMFQNKNPQAQGNTMYDPSFNDVGNNPAKAAWNLLPMFGMAGASVGLTPAALNVFGMQGRAAATLAGLTGSDASVSGITAPDYLSKVGGLFKGKTKLPVTPGNIPEPQVNVAKPNIFKTIGKELLAIEDKQTTVPHISKFPELQPIIDQLTTYIKGAPTLGRAEQEVMKHAELSKRVGVGTKLLEGTSDVGEAFTKAKMPLAGELPKPSFVAPTTQIVDATAITKLREAIRNSDAQFFQRLNTDTALMKVMSGEIPTLGELSLLKNMFGEEFTKAISSKTKLGAEIWKNIVDAANLPRAVLSSWDTSATLRQAAMFTLAHPIKGAQAYGASIKAGIYSKWAFEIEDAIRADPLFDSFEKAGGYFAPLRQGVADITKLEESFMSNLASYIPGVRQSERIYVTYLNKIRFDVFKSMVADLEKMGVKAAEVDLTPITRLINIATGRGEIGRGKTFIELAKWLNTAFFSPRLMMSRLQLPGLYATLVKDSMAGGNIAVNRVALKEATRAIAAFVGFGVTALSVASTLAGTKIEMDPRSSDFAKLKLGNTRIDPWAGFQQYIKFFAQFVTEERKVTSTGGIKPLKNDSGGREQLLLNFIHSKSSPIVGLLWDMLAGQTVIGEELEATPEGVGKQAFNRLVPLVIQDMYDAFQSEGLIGMAKASPGIMGMGITTYPDTLSVKQTQIGQVGEDGEPYTLNKFGSDVGRYGYSLGDNAPPLMRFYFESIDRIEPYFKVPADGKFEYRKNNPQVDAQLFFWGRVNNVQTPEASALVSQWLKDYGLPDSALITELSTYGANKPVPPTGVKTTPPTTLPGHYYNTGENSNKYNKKY